jgi:Protein of unknown function (DUF2924)
MRIPRRGFNASLAQNEGFKPWLRAQKRLLMAETRPQGTTNSRSPTAHQGFPRGLPPTPAKGTQRATPTLKPQPAGRNVPGRAGVMNPKRIKGGFLPNPQPLKIRTRNRFDDRHDDLLPDALDAKKLALLSLRALRSSERRGAVSTRVDRWHTPRTEHPVGRNLLNEVAALQRLSIGQLRQRFAAVFGEATHASNRTWLVKRIAWRLEALAERARRRGRRVGPRADLRLHPPCNKSSTVTPEPVAAPAPANLPTPIDHRPVPRSISHPRISKVDLGFMGRFTGGFARNPPLIGSSLLPFRERSGLLVVASCSAWLVAFPLLA